MAKNREPEKPNESESGEDDDEVSSEEVGSSESDSEPEPEQTLAQSTKNPSTAPGLKKPQPLPALKPPPPQPSSSSEEEEEESGSEPESDTEPVDQNVKPPVSKPMDVPQKPTASVAARKPRSKPNASQPSTPSKATGAKRPAEEKEAEAKDNKRSKKPPYEAESSGKPPSTPNDDSKKQLFQRLWSEDDEIVVLKGLIDYATKKKADPFTDLSDFHDFIRENLHVDVTRTQLQDKIRRLRKKYQNNRSKEKKGKERTFSKAHERIAYDLSNMIWGPGGSGNSNGSEGDKEVRSPKANGTAVRKTPSEGVNKVENSNSKEVKSLEVANGDVEMMTGSFGGVSMREWILRTGADLFEGEKRFEGHKEWRKLRVEEIELEEKRYDLMRAQTKLVLNILRSTDH
ncbi:DNA-binding storekeeper protein-related transcriptional regulator [Abeliophyllum distichum]|uniref:DNA-binding storekeeper protein-related transcriptional regulator n=1 Tax=Abeliophyllum distichum TaxID=126358 RepID=A0ABD1QH38_9LAMI